MSAESQTAGTEGKTEHTASSPQALPLAGPPSDMDLEMFGRDHALPQMFTVLCT